jgi:aquaporin Z
VWRMLVSEVVGTAMLVLGGLSVVIFMFGAGSPMERVLPSVLLRQVITGFLFGCVGASIAVSPVGKESGAHINPAVTLGFWLMQKLTTRMAFGYVLAQLVGSVLGALPLLAWGALGRSVDFGATVPGSSYTTFAALLGEVVTTFALVVGLCVFLAFRRLRRFTPLLMPPLYGVMVPMEAAFSGTSTNPARSFGPAVISGQWDGWWIYWAGPCLGTLAGILVCSALAKRIEEAKLYHFESQRRRLFHRAVT